MKEFLVGALFIPFIPILGLIGVIHETGKHVIQIYEEWRSEV